MRRTAALVLMAAALAAAPPAAAQTAYPAKPVTIYVQSPPGGNPDVIARLLAQKLGAALGQSFIVVNRPGAGATMAADLVSKAPADGYLLALVDSGAVSAAPHLYKKLPYDPDKDLTPITALAAVPTLIVLNPSVPAKTLAEFVAYAKTRPGQINLGTAGHGSIHHMTAALFAARAGIEFTYVPFRGGAPITIAVVGGEIHAALIGVPNARPHIESGKLVALGISTIERVKSLPQVRPIAEQGYAGFELASTMGLFGPGNLPPAIVAKLQAAIAVAIREPDLTERIQFLGMVLKENGTEAYKKLIQDEKALYAEVIKLAKIEAQ